MFLYYIELALRSFRSQRGLTSLMLLAIAMGLGASVTTLAAFRALSGDPLPGRSATVLRVQLDAASMSNYASGAEPDDQLTLHDAQALLGEHRAQRQAMMVGGDVAVEAADPNVRPFETSARYTSADFFSMFGAPFRYGGGWTSREDDAAAQVVVLNATMNGRLFGGADSIGKMLRVQGHDYRVVGVLGDWQPVPYFFDLEVGRFRRTESVFLPFATALHYGLPTNGSQRCWGTEAAADPHALDAPCSWIQYWAQVGSSAEGATYLAYLTGYSNAQHAAGRFERPANVRLRSVMDWLTVKKVVPSDVKLQVWLAFGFLAVCVVNTVGLLLAKCLRRSREIGVRRALGASRQQVFEQFLVEAAAIGLGGGILGLLFAEVGVWLVHLNSTSRSQWVHLDAPLFAATFAIALVASLLAGLLPAWHACQVSPGSQLKAQ